MRVKSEEISTFVCKDQNNGMVNIIHLFVYPESDSNMFKSVIDGYGNFYVPNLQLDKSINDQRMWCEGKLLAVFDGKVGEAEVKYKLDSTGFLDTDQKFTIIDCSRDGVEFSSDV